jgi:outer membrane protein OmpA-like peptidoglycan-associated protein
MVTTKRLMLLFLMIFLSLIVCAWADECQKAVDLYNKGTTSTNLEEKEKFFRQALRLSCQDKEVLARIHNNLADTYEQKGRLQEAVTEYKKALELAPDHEIPYISLGDVYAKLKNAKLSAYYYDQYHKRVRFKNDQQIISSLSLRSAQRSLVPVPRLDLYFGFNESTLTPESKKQLQELLKALNSRELQTYKFRLAGHTCDIGTDEYNQRLSENRAKAIKDWLEAQDYPKAQLVTIGFGKREPVADNGTEAGRIINRRVEVRTIGVSVATKRSRSLAETEISQAIKEGEKLIQEGKAGKAVSILEKAVESSRINKFSDELKTALGNLYLAYLEIGDGTKAAGLLKELKESD